MRVSEQLVRRSATEPAGTLRVAVAPLLGEVLLPAVISEYLDRYPKMRVELHLASEYLDLRRSNIDLALRQGPLADTTDLFAVRLGTSVTGCYAHPRYLAARGVRRRLAELASHDCIVVGETGTTWSFHERRREVAIERMGLAAGPSPCSTAIRRPSSSVCPYASCGAAAAAHAGAICLRG